MTEFLYKMRNGKIVDPNIPTDGLVCYLDARGKYNTDIYRNTLLDLSGNGNDGTLYDFGFSEESGYINDLSVEGASGLKFDGVDDKLLINTDLSQDFTIFTEVNIPATMSGDMRFTITCKEESFYNIAWIQILNYYTFFNLRKKVEGDYEGYTHYSMRDGLNKLAIRKNGDIITMFANEEKADSTLAYDLIPNKLVWFEKSTAGEGGELTDIKVYNRALTDEEITQLMEE